MEILSLIKEKISEIVIEKISGFLGEHPEKIEPALQSAIPTVLGSVMQAGATEEGSAKIMDILKDGGHNGEILDDLPNLLGNFDKTQLLITIGTNIFNHFSGDKNSGIIDKLASLNGIRKTSATSILGLAAPLVMGAIGKIAEKEGLGVSGLTRMLTDQKDAVIGALPPALASQLNMKGASNQANVSSNEKPKESQKSSGSNWLIPLLLLGILGIGLFAYWRKTQSDKAKLSAVEIKTDSVKVDTSFSMPPVSVVDSLQTNSQEPEKINQENETGANTVKEAEVDKTAPVKIEEPKKEIPVETSFDSGSFDENLKSSKSWFSVSNIGFGKNSAEIKKKGNLEKIVKYLKNNRKAKIQIAGGSENKNSRLAEDRAYSVMGYLIEEGVSENQIAVSSQKNDVNGEVAIKFIKR